MIESLIILMLVLVEHNLTIPCDVNHSSFSRTTHLSFIFLSFISVITIHSLNLGNRIICFVSCVVSVTFSFRAHPIQLFPLYFLRRKRRIKNIFHTRKTKDLIRPEHKKVYTNAPADFEDYFRKNIYIY